MHRCRCWDTAAENTGGAVDERFCETQMLFHIQWVFVKKDRQNIRREWDKDETYKCLMKGFMIQKIMVLQPIYLRYDSQ